MARSPLSNHRGPFVLMVVRPDDDKPGFVKSQWLKKEIKKRDDVIATAHALLNNLKDTVQSVNVWSEREQQFVTIIKQAKWGKAS